MPFSVIANVGAADANSYLTRTELSDYALSKVHNSDVTGASDATLDAGVVEATRIMDTLTPKGWPATSTQARLFPRFGLSDRNYNSIASTVIPLDWKDATAELACWLIKSDRGDDATKNIKSVKADTVKIELSDFRAPPNLIPDLVLNMVGYLLIDGGRLGVRRT